MSLDHSDRSFDPHDLCKSCGEHYVFKQGRCFECYHAEEQEHADQQRKEQQTEKHFGREEERVTDKTTGGPAFPQPAVISDAGDILTSLNFDEGGMTLRDYFAAKAIQGLIAQSLGTALGSELERGATYAYAMADEMIKERSK